MATELCTPFDNLGWCQPDEELLGMEEMTTPVEELRDWKNSFYYDKVDTRIAVKYALMKIYFEDILQESIGGAYDRNS